MLGLGLLGRKRKGPKGERTIFRVSDVVDVPLRGIVLRLRVVEGRPHFDDFGIGSRLDLRSPTGEERRVQIAAHSITGGRQSQARLERTRELDVLIEPEGDAGADTPIEIGWMASGPVT